LLQARSPFQESHWVLFRGGTVIARASAAEEEQARKARGNLSGDLLWFQLDGKTFITQDKDVLDRLEAAGSSAREREIALASRQLNQLAEQRKTLAQQQQALAQQRLIQASLDQVNRSLRTGAGADAAAQQQRELEAIQIEVAHLEVVGARMAALNAKREAEVRAMESELAAATRNAEQDTSREGEILRGAVREGKAQIVP
jgi:hypothetical protein